MRITGLKPERRNPQRLSLYIDGRFVVSLRAADAAELGLAVGREIDQQELERLFSVLQYRRARDYALLLLSYRARTEAEIHKRLQQKGFSPETIAAVLARFAELKLLDDERFAQEFAQDRVNIGHRGRWRVRAELLRRGVSRERIERALMTVPDEREAARQVLERCARRYAGLEPAVRRRRLYGLLARRGFSPGTIEEVMAEEEDGGGSDGDGLGQQKKRRSEGDR